MNIFPGIARFLCNHECFPVNFNASVHPDAKVFPLENFAIYGITATTSSTSRASDIPTDIATRPEQAPVQPKLNFPATLKGNKHHNFCLEWYKSYCWLEYSREKDAAYCYACHLFNTEPGKYSEKVDSGTGNMT